MEKTQEMPKTEVEQFLKEERDVAFFDPRGNRTKPQSGKSQVGGKWEVEKTQEMSKTEEEQFHKEEDVYREENGDGLEHLHRHVRKHDVSGEIFKVWRKGNIELYEKSTFRAQENDPSRQ